MGLRSPSARSIIYSVALSCFHYNPGRVISPLSALCPIFSLSFCHIPQILPRRSLGIFRLFFYASGGLFSFNSERKEEKNATKTNGFGFPSALCLVNT